MKVTFKRCCSFKNEDRNDRHRGFINFFKMTRAQDCSSLYFSWTSSALAGSHVFWKKDTLYYLQNWKMANLTFLRDPLLLWRRFFLTLWSFSKHLRDPSKIVFNIFNNLVFNIFNTLEFFKTSSRSFKDKFYPRESDWSLCVTLYAPNILTFSFSNGFHF